MSYDQSKDGMPPSDEGSSVDPVQFADESLDDSPRDPMDSSGEEATLRKRQRQYSPSPNNLAPGAFSGIAASPHKNKTFEELLAAQGAVTNMALAHEIVVDGNFKLSPRELPENSIEKKVHDIMHKAFWDSLGTQLSDDPPSFTHAVTLIGEVKETLLTLLLPQHGKLRTQIQEVLDLDLIRQQAQHLALDVIKLATFVIDIMSKLCAPARDEEIAKLTTLTEPVQIFREIFRVLELMKVDMANFTLQTLRPHLQQQSIEYERKKFKEFLETQQDGLQYTRQWLAQTAQKLASRLEIQQQQQQQQASGAESPVQNIATSPAAILNHGYVDLLSMDPKDAATFPETVLMDQGRIYEMGVQVDKLILVGSILLVTYTNTGTMLSGIQGFPSKLKHNLFILLEGVTDYSSVIDGLSEQVCKEVSECLAAHGFPEWDVVRTEAFKSQIRALAVHGSHILSIIDSRVRGFLVTAISAPSRFDPSANIPPGLSTMQSQLLDITKAFVRVVVHNRSVFGPFYAEILSKMVQQPVPSTS